MNGRKIAKSVRATMRREADRCDAMDELMKQLLMYEVRDLEQQPDPDRQFLVDTVNNVLRWKLGVNRIYEFAGVIQAAHMVATKELLDRTNPATAEAMNLAAGLCHSEANRMEAAHRPTAEHWRTVATLLHAGYLASGSAERSAIDPDLQ